MCRLVDLEPFLKKLYRALSQNMFSYGQKRVYEVPIWFILTDQYEKTVKTKCSIQIRGGYGNYNTINLPKEKAIAEQLKHSLP